MSLRLRSIPKSATKVREITGRIPLEVSRLNSGKIANVQFLAAFVSDGYKSEYTAHQAYYIVVRVADEKPWAKRYSGKNLAQAENQWAEIVRLLEPIARNAGDMCRTCGCGPCICSVLDAEVSHV